MSVKLYVGNLPFSMTENDLTDLFAQAGNVARVQMINDRVTGRPRGFGFVEMGTADEAQAAIAKFHGQEINGRAPDRERSASNGTARRRRRRWWISWRRRRWWSRWRPWRSSWRWWSRRRPWRSRRSVLTDPDFTKRRLQKWGRLFYGCLLGSQVAVALRATGSLMVPSRIGSRT